MKKMFILFCVFSACMLCAENRRVEEVLEEKPMISFVGDCKDPGLIMDKSGVQKMVATLSFAQCKKFKSYEVKVNFSQDSEDWTASEEVIAGTQKYYSQNIGAVKKFTMIYSPEKNTYAMAQKVFESCQNYRKTLQNSVKNQGQCE